MNLQELENEINNLKGTLTHDLLIGNGLGKSHPCQDIRKIFEFHTDLSKFSQLINEEPNTKAKVKCPEDFFRIVRRTTKSLILKQYINEAASDIRKEIKENSPIIKKVWGIFTLNYDPILYYCLLGLVSNFEDGFFSKDSKPISIDQIKKNYENKCTQNKGLYFLHGAFHIYMFSPTL